MEAEQIQSWRDTAVGVIGEARLQAREADKVIAILGVFVETYRRHADANGAFGLATSQMEKETGKSSGSCKRATKKLQELKLVKKLEHGNFKAHLAPRWTLVGLGKEHQQGEFPKMSAEPSASGSDSPDPVPDPNRGFKSAESDLIPSSFLGRKGSFQKDPINDPVAPRNDPENDPVHQGNDSVDDEDRPRRPWRLPRIKPENDPVHQENDPVNDPVHQEDPLHQALRDVERGQPYTCRCGAHQYGERCTRCGTSRAEVAAGLRRRLSPPVYEKAPPPLSDEAKAFWDDIKKPLYMWCPKCHPTMQLAERVSGEWRCEKCWEVMTPSFENLLGEEPFSRRGSAD